MKIKTSRGERIFDATNVIIISALVIVMLYPLWYVLMGSLSSGSLLMQHRGFLLLPLKANLDSYRAMMKNSMIVGGFLNTLIILLSGVSLNMVFTIVMAYFLSRDDIMWKKPMTILVIFTMYFSGGLIPTYLLVSKTLAMNDSWLALIIPGLINTYNLIILKTAFSNLPKSLIESAMLEGAGHIVTLVKIVVPLAMPSIAVIVLYYAVQHWNSWFDASIYLQTRDKYPLQLVLQEILVQNDTSSMTAGGDTIDQVMLSDTIKYAVMVSSCMPILVIFPFLQRFFEKGVMIGAVKG